MMKLYKRNTVSNTGELQILLGVVSWFPLLVILISWLLYSH